jgi:hypothetical protein
MAFTRLSQQTLVIYLNRSIFDTKMQCVHSKVGAAFLYIMYMNSALNG